MGRTRGSNDTQALGRMRKGRPVLSQGWTALARTTAHDAGQMIVRTTFIHHYTAYHPNTAAVSPNSCSMLLFPLPCHSDITCLLLSTYLLISLNNASHVSAPSSVRRGLLPLSI